MILTEADHRYLKAVEEAKLWASNNLLVSADQFMSWLEAGLGPNQLNLIFNGDEE